MEVKEKWSGREGTKLLFGNQAVTNSCTSLYPDGDAFRGRQRQVSYCGDSYHAITVAAAVTNVDRDQVASDCPGTAQQTVILTIHLLFIGVSSQEQNHSNLTA